MMLLLSADRTGWRRERPGHRAASRRRRCNTSRTPDGSRRSRTCSFRTRSTPAGLVPSRRSRIDRPSRTSCEVLAPAIAVTVPTGSGRGKRIVFIGAINFRDRKDLSQRLYSGRIAAGQLISEVNRVEIGQVEAFLAVGTFGGFRRAADALRVTQPAISARIRALEGSLGVP